MENKINDLLRVVSETRGDGKQEPYSQFIALYLSQKLRKLGFEEILTNIEDEKVKWALKDVYEENSDLIEEFKQISILSDKEWLEIIEQTSIFDNRENTIQKTPISIIKLTDRLLDIRNKDSILDICSGLGITLAQLSIEKDIALMGVEINSQAYIQSKLLLDIMNKDTSNIILGNALKTDISVFEANKVFINGPLGLRVSKDIYDEVLNKKFSATAYEELIPNYDSTWLFVLDTVLHSNFEKVVVVMNEAPLVNNRDALIRKQLMKDGLIEAIIDLPGGLLDYSGIPVSLLVLSKNNSNVSFVDATKLGTKKQHKTFLKDDDIEKIIKAIEVDGQLSKTCNFEVIENEDFIFSSKRYLIPDLPYENTVQLKDVVKTINRGAMISNKNLKEIESETSTPYQYLALNNFTNGIVDKKLPFIKKIDPSLEKHVIKNDSLIISKMSPFKVASIEQKEKQILVNGNLYFLEIDENKINPKYLEAYLQSEFGMRELQKYEKGTMMKTISIRDLEKIMIPVLTEEEQNKIGKAYDLLKREQEVTLERIKRIEEEKNNIMEVR
ncbi:N-6 DNA methylase [Virgibacillus senegalensis]|uniref:N-6 DNA methylase n=1 Tax=Virgibacillus senegalensis TaxID=1499679 RepID=UPI00069E1588|nr:N-6 DNA methylase [Virgibacillus senegalensis]